MGTGSWLPLDQLNQPGAWDNKHAQHVKENVNDFVFTSTGVPAVAWADGANHNHVYLSVWSGYSTAGSNDLNGFVVAGFNTKNRGAICPSGGVSCTKPSYEDPAGLSVDSHGDVVFVAITSAAKKKIYVEYINVSQTWVPTAEWKNYYESKDDGLLPRQPDGMCGDYDMEYQSAVPMSQSQVKLNCQGEVYVAHIVERRNSMSTAQRVTLRGKTLRRRMKQLLQATMSFRQKIPLLLVLMVPPRMVRSTAVRLSFPVVMMKVKAWCMCVIILHVLVIKLSVFQKLIPRYCVFTTKTTADHVWVVLVE